MNQRRTPPPRLEGTDLALWRALIRVSQLLPAALDEGLHEDDESLPRYEILAVLASVGDGLRLTELGQFALVSKPRLSVHVSSLEADGFVSRGAHPEDGRAAIVTLTSAGRRHLATLTAGHLGLARALAIDRIEAADRPVVLRALSAVLEALDDSWRPDTGKAPPPPRRR